MKFSYNGNIVISKLMLLNILCEMKILISKCFQHSNYFWIGREPRKLYQISGVTSGIDIFKIIP